MARLLIDNDYLRLIQELNLEQVISSNSQIKIDMEQAAQSEMISYLAQRYTTSNIFTNTTAFSLSAVYYAKNLVYLDATAFSAASTYSTNDLVLQAGNVYYSTAGSVAHAFDVSEWTLLGAQYAFFYVTLPESEFNLLTEYAIGDVVWYANKTYTCATACTGIVPSTSTTAFWGTGTSYSITTTFPTDGTVWTVGDNRNQQVVLYLLDITLYHLHSRINPRNIPDLRKERYDGNSPNQNGGAIGWLKRIASGDITADLPNIQPQQGMSIRYGNANDSTTQSNNFLW
jgi:hypothetical protein